MAIDWNKVIEHSINGAPLIIAACVAGALKLRKLEKGQKRIEEKNDGNHKMVLEEVKKAGRYEGHIEAKQDARFDQEQILKAVEQVLAAQSKQRGRRKTDPP